MVDSELRLSLVFNGCIYNYKELREELRQAGYRFFSTADSEVVLKSFHRWGPDCVHRFKGMFAFAVHEIDSGVVTIARDRLGNKTSLLRADAGAVAVRLDVAGAVARRRRGHDDRSCGVAPLPELRGGRAGPAHHVRGRPQAAAGDDPGSATDGSSTERRYWEPSFEPAPDRASWTPQQWQTL